MSWWDDAVIGEGSKGCSAVRLFDIGGEHGISENALSYWISDVYLGMGMTIFKGTDEALKLSQFANAKADYSLVEPWLVELLLKRVSPGRLQVVVKNALRREYARGQDDKAAAIRSALGL